jgi:hypothetical protein
VTSRLEEDFLVSDEPSLCALFNLVAFVSVALGFGMAVLHGVRLVVFEGVVLVDKDVCRAMGVPDGFRIEKVLLLSDLSRYV